MMRVISATRKTHEKIWTRIYYTFTVCCTEVVLCGRGGGGTLVCALMMCIGYTHRDMQCS